MNPVTSQQMMEIVERIRAQAEKARDAFDYDAARVESLSAPSISLGGGDAVSRVADIAAASRKACDKLYAALQSTVRMADEECRPLLSAQPSLAAVGAVYELIRWLNEESEIGANFSASLNGSSLGGVLSGRYVPAMESKMIESYWETKYDTWADWVCAVSVGGVSTADAPAAAPPVTLSPKAQALSDALARVRARTDFTLTPEELAYREVVRRWLKEGEELPARRDAEIERRVAAERKSQEDRFQASYERKVEQHKETMERELQRIREAQAVMKATPIFRMKVQLAQQEIINEADAKYREASEALKKAEETWKKDMELAAKLGEDERFFIRKQVLKDMPEPEAPAVPAFLAELLQSNLGIQKAILAGMEPGRLYTTQQLRWDIPVVAAMSPVKLGSMLRQMIGEQLEKVEENGKSYYLRKEN